MEDVYFSNDFGFYDSKKKNKQERSQRYLSFNSKTLQFLGLEYDVYKGDPGTYMYWLYHNSYGKITIYPKSDKLHLSKQNKWIQGAVKWLEKNIITETI